MGLGRRSPVHKTAKNESNHQVWPRIPFSAQVGSRVSLKGHVDVRVILEDVRLLGTDASAGYERRVRLPGGPHNEAVISLRGSRFDIISP